jgi:hypothetical protein
LYSAADRLFSNGLSPLRTIGRGRLRPGGREEFSAQEFLPMDKTQIILYAIMLVSAFGMIWANQQFNHKGVAWGRPLAGFCGLVALSMAITAIYFQFKGDTIQQSNMRNKENIYHRVAMKKLGAFLAETAPGSQVLLLMPPTNEFNKERQQATIDGLNAGFANKCTILEKREIGAGEEMMSSESFMNAKDFDDLVSSYDTCNMIISLVGLPFDYPQMKFWKMEDGKRPKLVVMHPSLTDINIQGAIAKGIMTCALATNPTLVYNPDDQVPSDETEAFNKRYLLIHAGNLTEMIAAYPRLFGQ